MQVKRFDYQSFEEGMLPAGVTKRAHAFPSLVDEPQSPAAAPPPLPSFTEQDLKNAEQEGFRRGFAEGESEGRKQMESEQLHIDRKLLDVCAVIAGKMDVLFKDYCKLADTQRKALPPVSLAIAKKIAGDALQGDVMPIIEKCVTECLEYVLGSPRVVVTVHKSLAQTLETRLIAHFAHSQEPGEIIIEGDENMPLDGCRITWQGGEATRGSEDMWRRVEQIIASCVAQVDQEPHAVEGFPGDSETGQADTA